MLNESIWYKVCSLDVYAFNYDPRFSTSFSNYTLSLCLVPLKCKCSKKWAAPDVGIVSFLEPVPINTPTADTSEFQNSVQTLMPFEIVVTSKGLTYFNGSGISPSGRFPN